MNCPTCNRKLKQEFHTYSSGDGCLSLHWVYFLNGEMKTASRKVTRADAVRYLNSERGKHLVGWKPVLYNNRWVLVAGVERTGKNKLRIDGHTYHYEWDKSKGEARSYSVSVNFKYRKIVGNGWETAKLANLSILMTIYFFLNHENKLDW